MTPEKPENREKGARTREFCQLYGKVIYTKAMRMLGDADAASEVTQSVYERVLRSEDSFRGESSKETWLTKITHNECIRYRNSRNQFAEPLGYEDPPDTDDDPHEALEKADFRRHVEIFMARLPLQHSRALTLLVNEQLSRREIAETLHISEDLVSKILQRAREKMKDMMTKEGIRP